MLGTIRRIFWRKHKLNPIFLQTNPAATGDNEGEVQGISMTKLWNSGRCL